MDGERESEDIIYYFIENIASSRYLAQKTIDAKSIDEAFDFFKKIADKEASYNPQPQINHSSNAARFPSASSRYQSSSTARVRKVDVMSEPKPMKCFRCGGFGHSAQQCATLENICHNYGRTGHMKKVFCESLTSCVQ